MKANRDNYLLVMTTYEKQRIAAINEIMDLCLEIGTLQLERFAFEKNSFKTRPVAWFKRLVLSIKIIMLNYEINAAQAAINKLDYLITDSELKANRGERIFCNGFMAYAEPILVSETFFGSF